MASPIHWTCSWANSFRWWGTGMPGMLQQTGSPRVGRGLVTKKQQYNNKLVLSRWFLFHRVFHTCSVATSCLTLYDPMDCSSPGFPVLQYLPEFSQVHVHWIGDAIQPSHPLLPSSPSAFYLSQHQGLFKWVRCSYQVAKVLELQLQLQFFQWIFRVDFL